jgi:hypothetical protein
MTAIRPSFAIMSAFVLAAAIIVVAAAQPLLQVATLVVA